VLLVLLDVLIIVLLVKRYKIRNPFRCAVVATTTSCSHFSLLNVVFIFIFMLLRDLWRYLLELI
jgi:hypothetical protein